MRFAFILILAAALVSHGGAAALCSIPYCSPPWRTFQGHCYLLIDSLTSWMDAERYCQMLSRPGKMVHLTSIHSKEEDKFVGEYVQEMSGLAASDGYWIGYNDRELENVFTWSDGSDVKYKNWNLKEPNNVGDEDCVERFERSEKWNDYKCHRKLRFVCKT